MTVSDKKIPVASVSNPNVIDYYNADVVTAQDYYPFGKIQPGRQYGILGRYTFNGKEYDKETKTQDYGMRIYSQDLGRFLSVDPLAVKYPFYTPYAFAGNDVIRCIDLDGAEPTSRTEAWKGRKFRSTASSIDVYDKVNHQVFVAHLVNDPNTGKSWIVADDGQGQNRNFYLRNDNGSTNSIEYYVENGRTYLHNGHFAIFETQNQKEVRFGNEIANGFSYMAVGIVAAPFLLEAAPVLLSGSMTERAAAATSDAFIQYSANASEHGFGFKNLSNINLTSVATSFAMPNADFASSFISNGLDFNIEEGYKGIGSSKANNNNILINSVVGGAGNKLGSKLDQSISKYLLKGKTTPFVSKLATENSGTVIPAVTQSAIESNKK